VSWSFDEALSTDTDVVRYLAGDTDPNDPLVSDELIAVYLTGGALEQTSVRLAAAEVATAIAASFARRPLGISAGGTQVNWGVMVDRYTTIANGLRKAEDAALAAANDVTGLFDVAELAVDAFGAREILANGLSRGAW
jgi:hypothetical protein